MFRLLVAPCLLLAACVDPPKDPDLGGDTGGLSEDSGTDSGTDTDDSEELLDGPATLSGTVRVALTWTDEDGETVEYDWAEATGDQYVFGKIFVTAMTTDPETGAETYWDSATVMAPSVAGDAWELTIEEPEDAGEITLYAAVDYWNDGILGTDEPTGPWPELLTLEPLEVRDGLDLVISTPWDSYYDWVNGGGGGGGGGSSVAVTLSGTGDVVSGYIGGDCLALLYYSDGSGPYDWTSFTPTGNGDGTAVGEWSMGTWGDLTATLLGACDLNGNSLIDPADSWGSVVEGDNNDNPFQIGTEDLSDVVIRIPYEGVRATVTPFATISGSVLSADNFSTWPAGSTLYVAALRSRPTGDVTVSDLAAGYDYVAFTGSDLSSGSVPYSLMVPTHKTLYVWAFGDGDGDGVLNEVGEPLGSPDNGGRISVGTADETGNDINIMGFVEETEE